MIKFRGLETVEKVRSLLKKELFVSGRAISPPLDEGEYYDYQLIGLEAITDGGTGRRHGKGRDAHRGERHPGGGGREEVLVPMTEDHIVDISQEDGFVRVREDGLVE